MPVTINIPNSNNTNTTPSTVTPMAGNPAPQVQSPQPPSNSTGSFDTSNNSSNSNGSDQWWNQSASVIDTGSNSKRLTPQERVELVEKLFQEVLGRKADTRDINYYKYSTLSEEEMRKQLITGKEHKQLVADGREFNKMRDRAMQAETRVKVLEGQIKDQVQEFQHLSELLDEKNKHIQELRVKLNNPYNLIDHSRDSVDNSYRNASNSNEVANKESSMPSGDNSNSFIAPQPQVRPIVPEVKKSPSFIKFVSGKIKEILP